MNSMFNEEIDVALIMRQIQNKIVPEDEREYSGTVKINYKMEQNKKRAEAVQNYILNMNAFIDGSGELGTRIPSFQRFKFPVRFLMRLTAKIVSRISRFITIQQSEINRNLQSEIKSLAEGQQYLLRNIELLQEECEKLKKENRKDE